MSGGKLLFVAPSAYPLGGVQTWLDYLMPGLRNLGWEVALALTAGRFHNVDAYLAQHPFTPVHIVSAPTGTPAGRVRALRNCFVGASPDIILGVNVADVYVASAAADAITGRSTKVVATLHGLQQDFLADFAAQQHMIDAIISTNRLAQRLAATLGGAGTQRALYAPYGVEPCATSEPQDSLPFRLAYVGRIENSQKRTNDLVSLLSIARDAELEVELMVAGAGPDEAEMRARVMEAGLDERVHFLGVLSPQETQTRVYADCDALIVTSNWETGPIVAWEAMIAGVPLLTSDYLGRSAEDALIDGENCLIFPVGDVNAAFERLRRLLPRDVRARLSQKGRDLVLQRYVRDASVAQWHAQLGAVLSLPPRACHAAPAAPPSGRLDRLLGVDAAEALRRATCRVYAHREPGGEWPHAYRRLAMSDADFWSEAVRLDAAAS